MSVKTWLHAKVFGHSPEYVPRSHPVTRGGGDREVKHVECIHMECQVCDPLPVIRTYAGNYHQGRMKS